MTPARRELVFRDNTAFGETAAMNVKRARAPIKKSQLENEVILAVVVLYVLLSAVMLTLHYSQRDNPETLTSSTSPSHSRPSPAPPGDEISATEARTLLTGAGYQEIHDLRRDGAGYRATAFKSGGRWSVQVDATSRVVIQTALDIH
jgi:hypothetical protein